MPCARRTGGSRQADGRASRRNRADGPDGADRRPGLQRERLTEPRTVVIDGAVIGSDPAGGGGPSQATIDALVAAAHERGLTVVVHASSTGAFAMALNSGAEVITHAPLDQALAPAEVSRMATGQRIAVPR